MNKMTYWDCQISRWCLSHRYCQQQAKISRWISASADGPLYALLAFYGFYHGGEGRGLAIHMVWAFAIELPLYWLLKNSVRRPRPSHFPAFITPSDRFSLPSGHAAGAFLMATLLVAQWPEWAPYCLLWASAVALSRLLLGVHYLSDLLIGAALGSGCALWALGGGLG